MSEIPLLSVLEAVASADGPLSIAALREITGIPAATMHRHLGRLCDAMYVEKAQHGLYRAGPALVALGSSVIENAGTARFRPLLAELVDATGLNAELYSVTRNGPTLLVWLGGRSEFRVRMFPGFRLTACSHPATAFFFTRYPGAERVWGKPFAPTDSEHWQRMLAAAERNFIIERGHTRPELARACTCTSDGRYCIGLSGLCSEFTVDDNRLERMVRQRLARFEHNREE